MAVSFEKTMDGNSVVFRITGKNNRILCVGHGYNNIANARKGAHAAYRELKEWADSLNEETGWHMAADPVLKKSQRTSAKTTKKTKMDGDYAKLYPKG